MISIRLIKKKVNKFIRTFKRDKNKVLFYGIPLIILISILLFFLNISFTTLIAFLTFSIVILILIYYSIDYSFFLKIKEAEMNYPDFLENLAEAKSSGMTLSQAVNSCSTGKYDTLTPYIKKLNTLLSWGMPFNKAWLKFTKELEQSELITRLNMIILEAFNSGADLANILSSLASRSNNLRIIENERKGVVHQQVVMMYILYFGFLGIILLLQKILLPTLYIQNIGAQGISQVFQSSSVSTLDAEYFKRLFMFIILIQSACSGILIGQILEERAIGGVKHIAILLFVGIVVFLLFINPTSISVNQFISDNNPSRGGIVNIGGTITIDGAPASGVEVLIEVPTREPISLKADMDGKYYTELKVPSSPGRYTITSKIKYKSKTKIVKEYINIK